MTSRKSSYFCSTIFCTLLRPEATTRMSMLPNLSSAALTILSQFSSDVGRSAITAALPPSFSHSAATFFSSSCLLAASTTLAPAPARIFADSAPKAPDAPVIMAVLPLMSNRPSGFFRNSSDMVPSPFFYVPLPVWRGEGDAHYFGGIATATTIEQTSLPRLMISRVSFGSMTQLSFAFSTVSLPSTITVNSPDRTK